MPLEPQMPADRLPSSKFAAVEAAMTDLGAAILRLKTSNAVDQTPDIDELEQRFSDLRGCLEELEAAIATSVENTESDDFSKHARAALGAATTKARTAWNELRERASKPDNTEALKQSMKDMGRGLSKGWGEVRKSLGNAYERLNASTRRTSEGAPARASNTGEGRSQ